MSVPPASKIDFLKSVQPGTWFASTSFFKFRSARPPGTMYTVLPGFASITPLRTASWYANWLLTASSHVVGLGIGGTQGTESHGAPTEKQSSAASGVGHCW